MLKKKQDNLFSKVKLLLFHPSQFFELVKNEKNEWASIKWAFVSVFVYGLMTSIMVLLFQDLIANYFASWGYWSKLFEPMTAYGGILLVFGMVVSQVVLLPVFHWLVTKLGGNAPHYQTAKAIFYSNTRYFLLAWIPIAGLFAWLLSLHAEFVGLKLLQKINLKQFIVYFIASMFVWLLAALLLSVFLIILVAVIVLLFSAIFNVPLS